MLSLNNIRLHATPPNKAEVCIYSEIIPNPSEALGCFTLALSASRCQPEVQSHPRFALISIFEIRKSHLGRPVKCQ